MRSSRAKWLTGLAAAIATGWLFQTGCMSFSGTQVLNSVDFCFLFDCTNGAFGGLFDPCPGQTTTTTTGGTTTTTDTTVNNNIFVDCPAVTTQ